MSICLFVDSNYLCHRAFHSMPNLTAGETRTEVYYGFFRELQQLSMRFTTNKIAFCFDSRLSDRKQLYPGYKKSREDRYKNMTPEEKERYDGFRQQVDDLRKKWLPALGYSNVFRQRGKEADDILAALVTERLRPGEEGVIVSNDEDLYQLLTHRVSIWKPTAKKLYTIADFKEEWGMDPAMWSIVKALAGCTSDDIPGIDGIGPKTAAKWVNGQLSKGKLYERIVDNCNITKRNAPLVKLPFSGTVAPRLHRNKCTRRAWGQVMKKLRMRSLGSTPPLNFK